MPIRYLDRASVEALAPDASMFVDAVRRALVLSATGRVAQPKKPYLVSESDPLDRLIAMPAALADESPIAGIKWIGSGPGNGAHGLPRASALIVLNDPVTKAPIAIMEGAYISAMRTAAVSALAIELLGEPGAPLALLGCGILGAAHVEVLLARDPRREIALYDLDPAAARRLATQAAERFGATVGVGTDLRAVLGAACTTVACTTARQPYIPGSWLPDGGLVVNVSLRDLEDDAYRAADQLVVDSREEALGASRVVGRLVEDGLDVPLVELGEVITGQARLGPPGTARTIVFPVGVASEDVACAQAVYDRAVARDAGRMLDA